MADLDPAANRVGDLDRARLAIGFRAPLPHHQAELKEKELLEDQPRVCRGAEGVERRFAHDEAQLVAELWRQRGVAVVLDRVVDASGGHPRPAAAQQHVLLEQVRDGAVRDLGHV